MNYFKKVGVSLSLSFGMFFIFSFLLTFLQYTGIISSNILKIIFTIVIFIVFLIGGITFGKKSIKKGWWEGIKLSVINIIIVLITTLLFAELSSKSSILYLIIFLGTTTGSIIGVNTKKTQN